MDRMSCGTVTITSLVQDTVVVGVVANHGGQGFSIPQRRRAERTCDEMFPSSETQGKWVPLV